MATRDLIVRATFVGLCAAAALAPLRAPNNAPASHSLPAWPQEWEGTAIQQIALSDRDQKFNENFPGRIAKFTDGRRELILRWVTTASRQLHSSADCFRGAGFSVTPQPALRDGKGERWSCFLAVRGDHRLLVRERIADQHGHEWTDVSAWFWSAALQQTRGPWLSVTIVETK
ncbi:MAG: hypothetical protein QOK24_1567 [Verrucomicrobiota bacterium]|jgi:hypothetical protein